MAAQSRPSFTIICDEARIVKRDILMTLLCGGGEGVGQSIVMASPLQTIPDLDETSTTSATKLSDLFSEVSRQFTARTTGNIVEKKKAKSSDSSCAPSRTLYSAASSSLNVLMGFTFSLCKPHHQFRPLQPGEHRCKLTLGESEYNVFKPIAGNGWKPIVRFGGGKRIGLLQAHGTTMGT